MRFEYNTEEHEKEYAVPTPRIVRNCKIYFTNQKYSELNVTHIHPRTDGKPHYFCRWKCSIPPVDPKKKPEDSYRHKIGKIGAAPTAPTGWAVTRDTNSTTPETSTSLRNTRSETRSVVMVALLAVPPWLACHPEAFDLDEAAINTYVTNFGDKGVAARQWLGSFLADIIPLSPPCRPFSPANTTPNELLHAATRAPSRCPKSSSKRSASLTTSHLARPRPNVLCCKRKAWSTLL
jgi:hypothetical protein